MAKKENIGLILTAILLFTAMGFYIGKKCQKPIEQPELLVIELTIELQERVGARPDGQIGPETKRLVNAQCEIDKPEYFNRCAVSVMERMAKEK